MGVYCRFNREGEEEEGKVTEMWEGMGEAKGVEGEASSDKRVSSSWRVCG